MEDWMYSLIAFIVVTAIITLFVQKRKKSTWSGYLFKKKFTSGDMDTTDTYTLIFKTEDGKKKRYHVSNIVFDNWEEGDKAEKRSGDFMPVKV